MGRVTPPGPKSSDGYGSDSSTSTSGGLKFLDAIRAANGEWATHDACKLF
jgi:hypothetical protein